MNTQNQNSVTRASLVATASHNARWFAGLLAGTALLGSSALAVNNVWDGDTVASDWNTAGNWSLNRVPAQPNGAPSGDTYDDAIINLITPNYPIITTTPTVAPRDIRVGTNGAVTGRVDHLGGTLSTGNTNWFFVGTGNAAANGTYNLADPSTPGGPLTGMGLSAGTVKVGGTSTTNGRLYVGGDDAGADAGTGVFNMNTSGGLTLGNDLVVGAQGGTGTFNLDAGTVTGGGWQFIGQAGGNGTLNMSGGLINHNAGSRTYIGLGNSWGKLVMSGGTYTNSTNDGNSMFAIGVLNTANANTSSVSMTGGTINAIRRFSVGGMDVGNTDNNASFVGTGKGSLTMNGANALVAVNGEFWVGQGAGSTGSVTLQSGTITVNNWIAIARGGNATFTQSGGTVTKTGGGSVSIANFSAANATVNISGGLFDVQTGNLLVGEGGTGSANLTLSGTGQIKAPQVLVGAGGTVVADLNLDGGTLTTNIINGAGGGTSNVDINGTQLIATGIQPTFITNCDTLDLESGGLLLNSNSFAIGIAQALNGAGGVVKSGGGTLTLSGANTYSGPRSITGGKLAINTSETGTGALTVADGAGFALTTTAANQLLTVANATFGTTGATTLDLNLGNFAGNSTVAPLNVSGTLTLNGVTTINVTDALPSTGIMPLLSFNGAIAGSGSFALGTLPNGVFVSPNVLTIDPNFYGPGMGLVYLDVDSASLPRWTGATNGQWDTTTTNWFDQVASAPSTYADPAPVLFNDTGVVNPNVVLNTTVAPSAVTFNNATTTYDLSGNGKITGTASLLKQGTGTVHIATANDYSGVTTLAAGTLNIDTIANGGVASSLGASSAAAANLVFSGGTLAYNGASTSSDRGFTNNGADNTISSALTITNDLTLSGPVNTVLGKFAKQGTGTLTLSNPGTNVLANGSIVAPGAFRVEQGGLVLSGGGTQVNTVTGEFWIGSTTAFGAAVTLNNTTLNTNTWLSVGRGNGSTGLVSSFTATGSTITTGNISLGYANAVAGHLATSAVTLNNSSFTTGTTYVSESAGSTANLTLNSSSFTAGQMIVGRLSGSNGTMTMNGASTASSTELTIGQDATSLGAMIIDGTSTFTTNNRLLLGNVAGANGSLTIQGNGVFNRTGGYLSIGTNGVGTVTVKGNGQFLNTSSDFNVSDVGVSQGTLNLQDSGLANSSGTVFIGKNTGTTGTVNQTGGTFNAASWISIGRYTGATGVVNISAGAFNQNGTGQALFVAEEGTGTLNVSGTGAVNVNGVALNVSTINGANAGTGVVNLDGGTITAKQVTEAGGGGGNGTFNFNGGLLKAGTGANATFISGLNAANVKANGAKIDSNGQTIAITQVLLDGTGGGGLTKSGTGTLQLNAANTYTGTTTVSAGSLGGTGSVAGPLAVSAGAAVAPGVTVGTFTAGATTIAGSYTCDVDGATADKLVVNGTLDVSAGKLDINLGNTPTAPALVIATYTGTTPVPFATVSGLPAGYALNYAYNDGLTSTNIAIVPSASAYDSWASSFGLDPLTDGAPGFDKDGDGQINSVEFALGGSPISGSDNAKIYTLTADSDDADSDKELLLTIAVRSGTPVFAGNPSPTAIKDGYTYTVQGSLDLSGFTAPVSVVAPVSTGLPAAPSGYEYRTFSLNGTNGLPAGTGFMRVTVTP
ncbi:autotransporter-associated beta strand repeat-containing protein [Haloferula sp. BvORR071]|uniref:beta strand repeat-containing protein n=1 Tax=Haloferula sp. BvORR071 TaxID=1396141 RepID=UPI0005588875|nr:autotransporter-associated beta strand repeat-containing protein [Haloferula sp. BvORR071]